MLLVDYQRFSWAWRIGGKFSKQTQLIEVGSGAVRSRAFALKPLEHPHPSGYHHPMQAGERSRARVKRTFWEIFVHYTSTGISLRLWNQSLKPVSNWADARRRFRSSVTVCCSSAATTRDKRERAATWTANVGSVSTHYRKYALISG